MDTLREPPHYLRTLSSTTTPKRLMWLDCTARTTKEHGALVARFSAAALGTTHYQRNTSKRKDTITTYDNADILWAEADAFCTKGKRVVMFAHDLAQQIRISQAMVHLPKYGWGLRNIVLERTAAWALYTHESRSLMLCDLQSWAPVPLGLIGADVTHGNVKYLDIDAGPSFPVDLCKARALIVRDAVLQILNWIEGENLGPFRPTGSGQSYSAYRRRFTQSRLLVHDDERRLTSERAAMHTGRCEAWRWGKLLHGPFVEYDMVAAYCTIAAECEVPTVAQSPIPKPTPSKVKRAMERYSVLAHVTVDTDIPVLPTRLGGRTIWPVGRFSTWVWDPELQLAFQYCNTVEVNHAYRYQRAPALRDFGRFVLDGLGEQTQVYGLVPKRVLKHWSRCLVGRLGLRYRSWTPYMRDEESDLRLWTMIDADEGFATDMLHAGHDWLMLTDMREATDSLPQIPSWVMSECRRRLWEAMSYVGFGCVVYVDTDSIIARAGDVLGDWTGRMDYTPEQWTLKGKYDRMTIHGPRNLVCDVDRRVSGVPLTARQTAPLEFTGQVMRSIKESMRAGELDSVAMLPRKFTMNTPDMRRQHLPNHQTAPFEVHITTQED